MASNPTAELVIRSCTLFVCGPQKSVGSDQSGECVSWKTAATDARCQYVQLPQELLQFQHDGSQLILFNNCSSKYGQDGCFHYDN